MLKKHSDTHIRTQVDSKLHIATHNTQINKHIHINHKVQSMHKQSYTDLDYAKKTRQNEIKLGLIYAF